MELGHPPCCSVPIVKKVFEESPCCISCSKLGNKWGDEHRKSIMLFAAFFSFLGMILSIVALVGVSTHENTVEDVAWMIGDADGDEDLEYYIGLNMVVVEGNGETYSQEWKNIDCSTSSLVGEDACDSCSDAANGIISTVAIAFVTSVTTLQTDIQRSTRAGDLNCQKFMGMFTAIGGMIGTLVSLSSFVNDCSSELPDTDSLGNSIDWRMGPGFVCLLIATIIKPIDFIAHYIVPVVKPKDVGESVNDLTQPFADET